jgi:PqqD family protein of HPr-rel-A system
MSDASPLKNLAISETGFVFDPRSGATYTLNPTGLAIVTALREGTAVEAIVGRLHASFHGAGEDVREHVADFVGALRRHGLVPADFKV